MAKCYFCAVHGPGCDLLIELDDTWLLQIRWMAAARTAVNRANGVPVTAVDIEHYDELDFIGATGEVGFGQLYNLMPDLSIGPRSKGPDYKMHNGITVDVKATKWESGNLILPADNPDNNVDNEALGEVFALFTGYFPNITYRGWATRWELLRPESIGKLRNNGPDTFILPQSALHHECLECGVTRKTVRRLGRS